MYRKNACLSVLFFLLLLWPADLAAQVGINTMDPNPSAVLHVYSTNRGVLFPSLVKGDLISAPADGLLIYNTNSKMFDFFNLARGLWQPVSPLVPVGNGYTLGYGLKVTHSVYLDSCLEVKQKVKIKDPLSELAGYGTVPIGGIIMWSGTQIPDGWALCDGTTTPTGLTTPDLRGRFVVGYGQDSSKFNNPGCWSDDYLTPGNLSSGGTKQGKSGGRKSIVFSAVDIPAHSHEINLATEEAGEHQHPYLVDSQDGNSGYLIRRGAKGSTRDYKAGGYYVTADPVTGLNEKIVLSPQTTEEVIDPVPGHRHFVRGRTKSEGSSSGIESRPPYYVLAFIMRIK